MRPFQPLSPGVHGAHEPVSLLSVQKPHFSPGCLTLRRDGKNGAPTGLSGPLPNGSPWGSLGLGQIGRGSRNLGQGLDGDMFMELAGCRSGTCLEPQLPRGLRSSGPGVWGGPVLPCPTLLPCPLQSQGLAIRTALTSVKKQN